MWWTNRALQKSRLRDVSDHISQQPSPSSKVSSHPVEIIRSLGAWPAKSSLLYVAVDAQKKQKKLLEHALFMTPRASKISKIQAVLLKIVTLQSFGKTCGWISGALDAIRKNIDTLGQTNAKARSVAQSTWSAPFHPASKRAHSPGTTARCPKCTLGEAIFWIQ